MINRRQFFKGAATAASGALLARLTPVANAADAISNGQTQTFTPPPDAGYKPVITTNNAPLPWKLVDGVKVFHLVAEPVTHEFAPGLVANCWGYNGRVHGPTIEAVEGDRVRIYVTNKLPEADDGSLARHFSAQRHGRRGRSHPEAHPAGRDVQIRIHRSCSTARSCITRITTR